MSLSHDPRIWLLWNMVRSCMWIFQQLHKLLLSSWQGSNSDTALYPALLLNIYTPVKHIKLAACAYITARWRSQTCAGFQDGWTNRDQEEVIIVQYFRGKKSRKESDLSSFGIRDRLFYEIAVSKYGKMYDKLLLLQKMRHSFWKDEREQFKPNNNGCHIIPVKSIWKWNPDLLRNVSL